MVASRRTEALCPDLGQEVENEYCFELELCEQTESNYLSWNSPRRSGGAMHCACKTHCGILNI